MLRYLCRPLVVAASEAAFGRGVPALAAIGVSSKTFVFGASATPRAMSADASAAAGGGSRFKIYTRTGDGGESSLYNGERRAKDDAVFDALGDVDELNSVIGAARAFAVPEHGALPQQLETIQSRLLDLGSAIATPATTSTAQKLQRVAFDSGALGALEGWIDALDAELPPLRNFILPSGGRAAAMLHLARTVCRRAERAVVPLSRGGGVDPAVAIYLNRLSDYLFMAARAAAAREGVEETVYKKGAPAASSSG